MADNVAVTEGSGKIIKTEDEGGFQYQVIKLAASGSGTTENLSKAEDSAHASGNHGIMALTVRQDTAAALSGTNADYQPLITDANGRLHVLDQNSAAILTAVQIMDDWDDGDKCKVILQTGSNAIGKLAANSGVDIGDVTLTAGTAAIGKLAANSGIDIGDVDVTSIVPGTGATNLGKAEDLAHSSGDVGVAAMTVRANSAVSLSGADNDYQPLITDTNGRLHVIDVSTTAIKTAVEIMDDWDAVHASAASADGPQIMGAGYSTALPTDIGADADAARICTDRFGRVLAGIMPQNFQATFTSANATSAAPVKAKTADRKMYILSLVVSVDTAMNVQFQDDTGPTVLIEGMYFAANGGAHLTWPPEAPLVVNTNEDFDVLASASGNVSVTITGYLGV